MGTSISSSMQIFPQYDGSHKGWEDFECTINGITELFEDEDHKVLVKLGGCMRLRLKGKAWNQVKKADPKKYTVVGGEKILLEELRVDCQDKPQVRTKDSMTKWTSLVRRNGEPIVEVSSRT